MLTSLREPFKYYLDFSVKGGGYPLNPPKGEPPPPIPQKNSEVEMFGGRSYNAVSEKDEQRQMPKCKH